MFFEWNGHLFGISLYHLDKAFAAAAQEGYALSHDDQEKLRNCLQEYDYKVGFHDQLTRSLLGFVCDKLPHLRAVTCDEISSKIVEYCVHPFYSLNEEAKTRLANKHATSQCVPEICTILERAIMDGRIDPKSTPVALKGTIRVALLKLENTSKIPLAMIALFPEEQKRLDETHARRPDINFRQYIK
jgi:hypothetical protein